MTTRTSTFFAHQSDRSHAGQRVRYLLGPLDNVDEPAQLRKRLSVIAGRGPATRIGLWPDQRSGKWRFDPNCSGVLVSTMPDPDVSAAAEAMYEFASKPVDVPLHIGVSPHFVFIDFDHGLGGGRLIVELIAAITSDDEGFAAPDPTANRRWPTSSAFIHTMRTSATQLIRGLSGALWDRPRVEPGVGTDESMSDGITVVYARSDIDYLSRLRREQKSHPRGTSVLALIISRILSSLEHQGVSVAEHTNFMVDLNRYLPDTAGTLSNFIAVAPVRVSSPYDPQLISQGIAEYTTGCGALWLYLLSSMAQRFRSPSTLKRFRGAGDSAQVIVSDHRMPARGQKIRWACDTDRVFLIMMPATADTQLSLAVTAIDDQILMSASFCADVFDVAVVQAALDTTLSLDEE